MSLYDTLRTVWQLERNSTTLQKLDPDFFDKARPYVNHLETQSKNEPDEILADLFKKRWMRVNYLINDIISLRIKKHIRDAQEEIAVPDVLPTEERKFRLDLNRNLIQFRNQALGIENEITLDYNDDNEYQLVVFTKRDSEATVGADLNTYGPFDEGDIAYLPSINVRNYLKRSQVERIELD